MRTRTFEVSSFFNSYHILMILYFRDFIYLSASVELIIPSFQIQIRGHTIARHIVHVLTPGSLLMGALRWLRTIWVLIFWCHSIDASSYARKYNIDLHVFRGRFVIVLLLYSPNLFPVMQKTCNQNNGNCHRCLQGHILPVFLFINIEIYTKLSFVHASSESSDNT